MEVGWILQRFLPNDPWHPMVLEGWECGREHGGRRCYSLNRALSHIPHPSSPIERQGSPEGEEAKKDTEEEGDAVVYSYYWARKNQLLNFPEFCKPVSY